MMILLLSLLIISGVVIGTSAPTDLTLAAEFAKFISHYGKDYGIAEELTHRFKIFSDNFRFIQIYNKNRKTESEVELGVNQFTDLTMEEFKEMYLKTAPGRRPCKEKHIKIQPDPYINWIERGKVSRVKNQGSCGSCWAFSAIGAVESLHAIKDGSLTLYSEQELVDCSKGYGDNDVCD